MAGTLQWPPIPSILWLALTATCVKILLVPSYHSTDFEVHRNWLAITHSLPIWQWYTSDISEWTLDYPPLFAWFEYALSFPAALVDPVMVDVHRGINLSTPSVVLFQRLTVIASDSLLYYATWRYCRSLSPRVKDLTMAAVIFSPGLIIVDHIHFQYNGFLLGILILSLSFLKDELYLLGGITFAILVCFKHLFAVAGPFYVAFLLRNFCLEKGQFIRRFAALAMSVLAVTFTAFGPFLAFGQLSVLLSRLFPFGRGLCHAYWAPNFWAIYNVTDKFLAAVFRKLGLSVPSQPSGAFTGGLVGETSRFAILPQVSPAASLALVLLAMVPCLVSVWKVPGRQHLVKNISFVYMCAFMFGWHVHEKASLHFMIPLALTAFESKQNASDYVFLTFVSTFSMFPLLFGLEEYPIKWLLLLIYTQGIQLATERTFLEGSSEPKLYGWHNFIQNVFTFFLLVVEVYNQLVHPILWVKEMAFLPLLLISVTAGIGMVYMWLLYTWQFLIGFRHSHTD